MRNFKRTVLFLLVGVFVFATFSLNSNAAGKWSIVRGYAFHAYRCKRSWNRGSFGHFPN